MKKNRRPIDPQTLPYRPCVGIMVLNAEGLVWTGRRIPEPDSEFADTPLLWQMPQGGIDKGEDPYPAALRELYEETGMRDVALLAEAPEWISYDLPANLLGVALKGKFRGQTQKWFAVRHLGNDDDIAINPPPGGHDPEFEEWTWRPMAELPDLIVPFKRHTYVEVVAAFRHLVK